MRSPDASLTQHLPRHPDLWLPTLRRYLLFVAGAHLVWETIHLPPYKIWKEGMVGDLAFAAVHCTSGDLVIALSSLVLALLLVVALTVAFGLGYTIFSEWLNIVVRQSWAYSDLMPVIPLIDTGLSPVAQWIVIPLVGLWWVRRRGRKHTEAAVEAGVIPIRSKSHV